MKIIYKYKNMGVRYNIKPLKLISEDEPINKIDEINKNREKINELVSSKKHIIIVEGR